MKYIRTEDGIYENAGTDALGWRCVRYKGNKIALSKDDDKIVKESDTIKELCDVIIYTDKYGNHEIIYGSLEQKKARVEEIIKMGLKQGDAFYGAIWTVGEHGEPILKSAAEMNKEGKWKLL